MDNQLICAYSAQLRTSFLMDRFEQRDAEGLPIYRALLLTDCFFVQRQERYAVSLQIERWAWRKHFVNDFMTFSRFKKDVAGKCFTAGSLEMPAVVQQIFLQDNWLSGLLIFPDAVVLHAQCSANRMGVGSSVYAGARRYGETTQYLITGAALHGDGEPGVWQSGKGVRKIP